MNRLSRSHLRSTLVTSIIFTLLLGSCTVYYNTSDIKKTFSQSQREMNKSLGKIAKDRREKREIYNQLMNNIPDSSVAPYPALSMELVSMTRSFSQLKQGAKTLEQMKANFNRLVKGRKKIESGSTLWDDFQTIKMEYDKQSSTLESQAAAYNKSSNTFVDLLNKHKIANINVVEVREQIGKYSAELNQSVQLISDELDKSQKHPKLDKNILDQLEAILAGVKADQQTLDALVQDFEKEVGEEPNIWSGPGMHSYSIMSDMEKVGAEISAKGDTFNKLAGKL